MLVRKCLKSFSEKSNFVVEQWFSGHELEWPDLLDKKLKKNLDAACSNSSTLHKISNFTSFSL